MNNDFIIKDGVLVQYKGNKEYVWLPSEIIAIGDGAFRGNRNIKIVTIYHSLKYIGHEAFYGCERLEHLNINRKQGEVGRVGRIGRRAFSHCINFRPELTDFIRSVRIIGDYAFEDCGTEYIHLNADYGFHVYRLNPEYNDNPEPEGWFYGCQKLKRVSNDPIADVQIFPGMFENCTALTHIDLNCIGINQRAFKGCTALKALTAYTFFIREESFANCTALETIDFSRLGIASNCERAFANCTSLKEIVMTERCSSIRPGMFMGCTGLKSAVLPDTLEEVAEDAFSGCTALEDISYFHVEQTEEWI